MKDMKAFAPFSGVTCPSPLSKTLYRHPTCPLCTDQEEKAPVLTQTFLDRWQIECKLRDEKEIIGVGEVQVRGAEPLWNLPL